MARRFARSSGVPRSRPLIGAVQHQRPLEGFHCRREQWAHVSASLLGVGCSNRSRYSSRPFAALSGFLELAHDLRQERQIPFKLHLQAADLAVCGIVVDIVPDLAAQFALALPVKPSKR